MSTILQITPLPMTLDRVDEDIVCRVGKCEGHAYPQRRIEEKVGTASIDSGAHA